MIQHFLRLLVASALLALPAHADRVTVFAAASLGTALDEIAAAFEAESGHDLAISLAATSLLARQIEQGAPAEVFLAANADWMDRLEEQGLIATRTRRDLLSNTLVLIAPAGEAAPVELAPGSDLAGRLGERRLAMALVDAVPAGLYGKAALESLGLWDALAPRVAQTDNVRVALSLVAAGEAALGIVYGSDARAESRVEVVATFPPETHPVIVYPVAALAGRDRGAAAAFLDFLTRETARAAFERQGFTVLGR